MKMFLLFFLILAAPLLSIFPTDAPAEQVKTDVPDPMQLKGDWWAYFHEKGFAANKERALAYYRSLVPSLPETVQASATYYIDRIEIGLNTLQESFSFQKKSFVEPSTFQQSYSLSDFLHLGEKLYNTSTKANALEKQIALLEESIKGDQETLDDIFSNYLNASSNSAEQFIKGLSIIMRKIQIEVEKKQLLFFRQRDLNLVKAIDFYENEIEHARAHIHISENEGTALDQQIGEKLEEQKSLALKIDAAQKNFISAEVQNDHGDAMQMANARSFYYDVTEGLVTVQLIKMEIQKELIKAVKDEPSSTLLKTWRRWSDKLEEIERMTKEWRSEANIELGQNLFLLGIDENYQTHKLTLAEMSMLHLEILKREMFSSSFLLDELNYITKQNLKGWKASTVHVLAQAAEYPNKHINRSLFSIGQTPISLKTVFRFCIGLAATIILAMLARRWIRYIGKKKRSSESAGLYTLSRLVFYFILIFGIIVSISTIGLDFTAFAVIAGALSVGIGFGLQSIVLNFFSGLLLLLDKTLRVGDVVQLESGEVGTVKSIHVRTTLLKTFDGTDLFVPNSELVSKRYTNWTLSGKTRRVRVPFSVAYGTDKQKVKEVVEKAAWQVPTTLDTPAPPTIWMTKFGESSLDFDLVVWVNEYVPNLSPPMATPSRYLWVIEKALVENGIVIPFPQRDVHMKS